MRMWHFALSVQQHLKKRSISTRQRCSINTIGQYLSHMNSSLHRQPHTQTTNDSSVSYSPEIKCEDRVVTQPEVNLRFEMTAKFVSEPSNIDDESGDSVTCANSMLTQGKSSKGKVFPDFPATFGFGAVWTRRDSALSKKFLDTLGGNWNAFRPFLILSMGISAVRRASCWRRPQHMCFYGNLMSFT